MLLRVVLMTFEWKSSNFKRQARECLKYVGLDKKMGFDGLGCSGVTHWGVLSGDNPAWDRVKDPCSFTVILL